MYKDIQYVSNSKMLPSFTSWQNGYYASREPTFRHDIHCSLVGWAASSTEAASDPLALLGLIIAGPLGMLEQVSNWARLHHITPTPHCWQVPRGQVMSWHGCPVSELVPGLPLTCPPPFLLLLLLHGEERADRPDGALGVPAGASCKGRYPRWRTPVLTRAPQLPQCIWCGPADPSWGNEALTLRRNAPSVALREALIAEC